MSGWEDKLRAALGARGGEMHPSFPSRLTQTISEGSPPAPGLRWDLVAGSVLVAGAILAIGGVTGYRVLHAPNRPAGVPTQASPAPTPSPASGPLIAYPTEAVLSAPSAGPLWDQVGGYLFLSTNQGSTWAARSLPAASLPGNVSFIDAQHGWRLASQPGSTCTFELWSTDDGARTWAPLQPTGIPAAACPSGVSFVDALHGYIAASDPSRGPTIYRTADAGRSWLAWGLRPDGSVTADIRAFGSIVLASVDLRGSTLIYRSADGGATWQLAGTTGPDVGFVTATRWISLSPNQSQETTDGGASWHALSTDYSQAAPVAPEIVFATPQLGYATVRGEIQMTTDGGAHWATINGPGSQ